MLKHIQNSLGPSCHNTHPHTPTGEHTVKSAYAACQHSRKTPPLTNAVLSCAMLLHDSSPGESAVHAGSHKLPCVCVCVCMCEREAAAIWEIDGRGRRETMSCVAVFFPASTESFLSFRSLFPLLHQSSPNLSFLRMLKLNVNSSSPFSPPACCLPFPSFSLTFIHLAFHQPSHHISPTSVSPSLSLFAGGKKVYLDFEWELYPQKTLLSSLLDSLALKNEIKLS